MPECVAGAARPGKAKGMEPLKGYDANYALRGWQDAGKPNVPVEVAAHDPATLRAQLETFMAEGGHGYVELAAWSFELNDWVRMEAFRAS